MMTTGDIWFVDYPYDDDPTKSKHRPVILLKTKFDKSLTVGIKITTHAPRSWDCFDVEIIKYTFAGLRQPSTARTAHSYHFTNSSLSKQLGTLHNSDLLNVLRTYYKWYSQKINTLTKE